MNYIDNFNYFISKNLDIDIVYVRLILGTCLVVLIALLLKKIGKRIIRLLKDSRKEYIFYQNYKIVINVIQIIILFFIWEEYIKSLMTLISFLSAAIAIALKDIILNWFCGIYIRIKKIFKIEDRIEINGIKGDVMKISTLEFEILEVSNKEENGQSTGIVITFPNSIVFTQPVKNYTKGFKYIWNEMVIKVPLDCDLIKTKQEIYKIINSSEIVKAIPKKMKNQISNLTNDYRIYYNQYEPIIYTKVVDDHIELSLRYLIHPKKARYVESVIWNSILVNYKNGIINLYK